jgi:hypothetical protein
MLRFLSGSSALSYHGGFTSGCRGGLLYVHVESVGGVDSCPGGEPDGLAWLQREAEAAQHHCQGHHCLHQGKLIPHTLARAAAEWDVPKQEKGTIALVLATSGKTHTTHRAAMQHGMCPYCREIIYRQQHGTTHSTRAHCPCMHDARC